MLTVLCDCFILVFIAIDIKAVSYVHVKVNMLKTTTKKHLQGLPDSRLSVPSWSHVRGKTPKSDSTNARMPRLLCQRNAWH